MSWRLSIGWIVVGALAVIGGFWIGVRSLVLAQVHDAWLPYAAHALGAAIAGASMVALAPLRPTREPLAAGVLAIAMLALVFLVPAHPEFSWVAARAAHPWPVVGGLALLSGASAIGGALVGRAITRSLAGSAAIAILSALAIMGTVVFVVHASIGLTGWSIQQGRVAVIAIPALALAGFAIQSVLSVRRPWTCGSGALVLIAWAFFEDRVHTPLEILPRALFAAALVIPIVYVGARLGWRFVARHHAASSELPSARLY